MRNLALGSLQVALGGVFVAAMLLAGISSAGKLAIFAGAAYWILNDALRGIERLAQMAIIDSTVDFNRSALLDALKLSDDERTRFADEAERWKQEPRASYRGHSPLIDLVPAAIPIVGSLAVGWVGAALLG